MSLRAKLCATGALLALTLWAVGCTTHKDTFQKAGEKVDDAVYETGKAAEKAADATVKATQKAVDETGKALEKAGKKMQTGSDTPAQTPPPK